MFVILPNSLIKVLHTFPNDFFQVTTYQMCNFPIGNFPSMSQPQRYSPSVCSSRGARTPSPFQPQRPAPKLQPAAPQRALPNLWEIVHLGSYHLGNCHLGNRPWENAFGKVPNTSEEERGAFIVNLFKFYRFCPTKICRVFLFSSLLISLVASSRSVHPLPKYVSFNFSI